MQNSFTEPCVFQQQNPDGPALHVLELFNYGNNLKNSQVLHVKLLTNLYLDILTQKRILWVQKLRRKNS